MDSKLLTLVCVIELVLVLTITAVTAPEGNVIKAIIEISKKQEKLASGEIDFKEYVYGNEKDLEILVPINKHAGLKCPQSKKVMKNISSSLTRTSNAILNDFYIIKLQYTDEDFSKNFKDEIEQIKQIFKDF